MAKQCKDFTFMNSKVSDLGEYIFVDFDVSEEIALGMNRTIEQGDTNRYRTEPNTFYASFDDPLAFEFDVIKDPCTYSNQLDAAFTREDIRSFTRWLTSPHMPQWLRCDDEDVFYKGYFENIETFVAGSMVVGLRLHFKCTSSFAYTDVVTATTSINGSTEFNLEITDDDLENYVYPTILLHPTANGQVYLCNLSDCNVLEEGTIKSASFEELLNVVDNYAKMNGYDVVYANDGVDMITIADETAVQFYLTGKFGDRAKGSAFYDKATKKYKIVEGGFMYMNLYSNLDVYIDTNTLQITDSLDRMITYDKLGVKDVDNMYMPRLVNGMNNILLYGSNCILTVKYRERRKVGE